MIEKKVDVQGPSRPFRVESHIKKNSALHYATVEHKRLAFAHATAQHVLQYGFVANCSFELGFEDLLKFSMSPDSHGSNGFHRGAEGWKHFRTALILKKSHA